MSIKTGWEEAKQGWRALLVCCFITIGAFQFGFDTSYYSGILAMQPFLKIYGQYDPVKGDYFMSASKQSLTSSIIQAGEFVGAVSSYLIADRIGRRGGLFVSSAFVIVGTTIQVASTHIASLIVGRLVLGYAVGLISCFVPVYVADCAPKRFRGALVCNYQFCIGLGLLLGVIIDNSTHLRTDTGAFRIPMATQYVFPLILLPGLVFWCPESPRWLVEKGKIESARKALYRLNGPHPEIVERELADLQAVIGDAESIGTGTWADLFRWGPEGRKAYLGFALQALQQGTGINFITGYGIVFFVAIGITNAYIIQLGLYLAAMPALWICQIFLERNGRRPILIVSGLAIFAVLMIMGGAGLAPHKSDSLDKLIVSMTFLFLVVFNLGWGPAVWVVTSEISTGRNRGQLMSLSSGSNWFFDWLVSFTFPYLFDADAANLGAKVGFIYAAITFCAVVWVYFFLPETRGRSLEEIDILFREGVPAKGFAKHKVTLPHELYDEKIGQDHIEDAVVAKHE